MYCNRCPRYLKFMGFLILICVLLGIYMFAIGCLRRIGSSDPHYKDTAPLRWDETTTVHIGIMVHGESYINRSKTMLKSILYSHRGIHNGNKNCNEYSSIKSGCPKHSNVPHANIQLHVLSDARTMNLLKNTRTLERLGNLSAAYYDVDREIEKLSKIRNKHLAGVTPFLKLIITAILPETVTKVIMLDSDIIVNEDIVLLWKQFELFNEEQSLAAAHEPKDTECAPRDGQIIPAMGINAGLLLLHLDRLRKNNFVRKWHHILQETISRQSVLHLGEQGLLNSFIKRWPKSFHTLPCEWNVQVYFNSRECCPVSWPIIEAGNTQCYPEVTRVARLVHYNTRPKPPENGRSIWTKPRNHTEILTPDEIHARYATAFNFFNTIPDECFRKW